MRERNAGPADIKTAIPKRRYQIGDFGASLLGEIESGDARATATSWPSSSSDSRSLRSTYSEQSPPPERERQVCAAGDQRSHVRGGGYDEWGDLDAFAEQGLRLGVQALGLQQEQIARLM